MIGVETEGVLQPCIFYRSTGKKPVGRLLRILPNWAKHREYLKRMFRDFLCGPCSACNSDGFRPRKTKMPNFTWRLTAYNLARNFRSSEEPPSPVDFRVWFSWKGLGRPYNDNHGEAMLPVKKMSKMRSRTRQAHRAMSPINLSPCPSCGKLKLPHAACQGCGYVSAKLTLKVGEKES